MKKTLLLILAVAMTLSLCACGGSAQPQIIYVETAPATVSLW